MTKKPSADHPWRSKGLANPTNRDIALKKAREIARKRYEKAYQTENKEWRELLRKTREAKKKIIEGDVK